MALMGFKLTMPSGKECHDTLKMDFKNLDELKQFLDWATHAVNLGWEIEIVDVS